MPNGTPRSQPDTAPAVATPVSDDAPATTMAVLVVHIDGVLCGVRLSDVVEVLPAAQVRALPGAPSNVLGVINLRGDIVAVLDGRRCLGRDDRPLRPSDRFVVVEWGSRRRAVRVDSAERIAELSAADVESAEALAPGALRSAGVVRLGDGLLVIVDPTRFLSERDDDDLERLLEEAARR